MIKYLVSDLDGTLFYGHGSSLFDLSKDNKKMMELLKDDEDVMLCIASGRNIYYGQYLLKKYQNHSRLIAGYNGASIYDNGNLYEKHLGYEFVRKIYALSDSFNDVRDFQILLSNGNRIFKEFNQDVMKIYQKEMIEIGHGKIEDILAFEYLNHEDRSDIVKVVIDFNHQEAMMEDLDLVLKYKDECTITSSGKCTIEISAKGFNKGSFIDYLIQKYHIKNDEIATIGDAMNDVDMFNKVKYSFVMSHADENIKKHALYEVNSVYEAYKMIKEINDKL